MKKLLLLFLALTVCTFKAKSQSGLAVEYRFDAPCTSTCSGQPCHAVGTDMPFFVNPAILSSAGNFTRGTGLSGVGTDPCGNMNFFAAGPGGNPDRAKFASGWGLFSSTNIDPNDFFGLTLTPGLGQTIGIDSIVWWSFRSPSAAPQTFHVRTSDDSYSSNVWSLLDTAVVWRKRKVISGLPTTSIPLTLRIYGTNRPTTNLSGTYRVDSVRVYAHVISTLPVSLLSFTGEVSGNTSLLKWTTASEQDNSHFEVWRSGDAEAWEKIGQIASAGDSQSQLDYRLVDERPLTGTNYYRLTQVDHDGTSESFNIVIVYHGARDGPLIFPNPSQAREIVTVQGTLESLSVTDALGRNVSYQKVSPSSLTIEQPGTYFVTVVSLGKPTVHKVIIY